MTGQSKNHFAGGGRGPPSLVEDDPDCRRDMIWLLLEESEVRLSIECGESEEGRHEAWLRERAAGNHWF